MSETRRAVVRRLGGPDAIELETVTLPPPGGGEVTIRQEAIGVNFIDTYQRSGLYPVTTPSGLGCEAAGTIEAAGADVRHLEVGDRVAYAIAEPGAYASRRIVPADRVVRVPDAIDAATAAAVMLRGMTVDMLVGACARIEAGQTVLVHAAAGGVGSLLVPWLKAIGAVVVAHAGTKEKAGRATAAGADHGLSGPLDRLAEEVSALTGGRGVDVVLDGVGAASWDASLASIAPRGTIVSYGNASGPPPAVAPLALARAGSVFLTRPVLFDYIDTRERLEAAAARLFAMIGRGVVPVEIGRSFALADAADAHRALEARATTGSTILLP